MMRFFRTTSTVTSTPQPLGTNRLLASSGWNTTLLGNTMRIRVVRLSSGRSLNK
jgi:hypothetical protein